MLAVVKPMKTLCLPMISGTDKTPIGLSAEAGEDGTIFIHVRNEDRMATVSYHANGDFRVHDWGSCLFVVDSRYKVPDSVRRALNRETRQPLGVIKGVLADVGIKSEAAQ